MATRFLQQAQQQLNPIYQGQEQAISSQVPAIQNLYNTLIQGLQGQFNQQLETGTRDIVEDASARGVLRSTLPVDARQGLQTQLGQALLAGRSQLESQRAGDISGINERLGNLKLQRTGAIADLARALETQDLERRRFQFQKQQAKIQNDLAREELAIRRSSSGGSSYNIPQWQLNQMALSEVATRWKPGGDGYVSPAQWNRFRKDWSRAGLKTSEFDKQFASLINPAHFNPRKNLPKYSVSASIKKQLTQ